MFSEGARKRVPSVTERETAFSGLLQIPPSLLNFMPDAAGTESNRQWRKFSRTPIKKKNVFLRP